MENITDTEIKLDKMLRIDKIQALYNILNKALAEHNTIKLDASAVELVDTAAMQLIYCFLQKAENSNIKIIWENPSSLLLEHASQLGMVQCLGLNTHATSDGG